MRATKSRKPSQSTFEFRTWGGRRPGAGRKPAKGRRTVPHLARAAVARSHPVHVTFRMAAHVWNLRFRAIATR